jgi:hypothetical protein
LLTLTIHPLTDPRLAHERSKAVFQHARANTTQNVVAAVLLEHDVVDAAKVQQL